MRASSDPSGSSRRKAASSMRSVPRRRPRTGSRCRTPSTWYGRPWPRTCPTACPQATSSPSSPRSWRAWTTGPANPLPSWSRSVDGGTDGTPNTCIVFKHGREPMVARKVGGLKLVRGEKVSLRSGGGGGWGPPLERDPERVLSDVRNEYLTVEQARDIYGVVVEGMQVDGGRTQRRREEMRRGHRERRP